MKKAALYLLLLFGFSSFCLTAYSQEAKTALRCHKTFTSAELKEDLLVLTTTLRQAHPDLYRVSSQEEIEKRIQSIEKEIWQPRSYLEFLRLIAPLFTDIGCINTQWGHSPEYVQFRKENIPLFPLQLSIYDERIFIKDNYSADSAIHLGSEVLSINGIRSRKYLKENYALLPTDGEIRTVQQRWLENYFPGHHSNFWEQPDTFHLLLKAGNGKKYRKAVPALLKAQFRPGRLPVTPKPPLQFSVEDSIATLTLRSFNSVKIEEQVLHYGLFIDSCFIVLREEKPKALILDLRGSGWGNLECGIPLLCRLEAQLFNYVEETKSADLSLLTFREHISDPIDMNPQTQENITREYWPQDDIYEGNLYIITDGWAVDAKGFFCTKIRTRPRTYFAGEETGACTFGVNTQPLTLTLPHTGIQVFIPTVQLRAEKGSDESVRGVQPDYPFKGNMEGDGVVRAVRKRIKEIRGNGK